MLSLVPDPLVHLIVNVIERRVSSTDNVDDYVGCRETALTAKRSLGDELDFSVGNCQEEQEVVCALHDALGFLLLLVLVLASRFEHEHEQDWVAGEARPTL